jgi:hypothetical protein
MRRIASSSAERFGLMVGFVASPFQFWTIVGRDRPSPFRGKLMPVLSCARQFSCAGKQQVSGK